MAERLKYLVLSDIHLGARSTTAEEIIQHLRVYFDDFRATGRFSDIDLLFIAGDLFDDTLVLADETLGHFLPFLLELLEWAVREDIVVRFLEGTPRHDRGQSKTLSHIAKMTKLPVDFKYIPSLSIERIERFKLTVLYVPDECRHTAEAIRVDTEQLLIEEGLEKVDIAIMHGMFRYQLGTIPMNSKVHDEAWWLDHVHHYLNIGHVHSHSQYGRILAQGSFDRLEHGQEEAKGGILVERLPSGEWIHHFVENRHAKLYKTLEVKGSLEQALKAIDRGIKGLPSGSHVRIKALSTHPVLQGLETVKKKYPDLVFTKKPMAEEDEVVVEALPQLEYVPIVLTRDTLSAAVYHEVISQHPLEPLEEERLHQLLEALHD